MNDITPGSEAEPAENATGSRRRTILIVAVVGALVVVGAIVAGAAGVFGAGEPAAVPSPSTVTLSSPTPTVKPAARKHISAFADKLPGSVLSYAFAGIAPHPGFVSAGAIEAYKVDYSDGGKAKVTVYAGQWETAKEAGAVYGSLIKAPAAAKVPAKGAATPAKPTTGKVWVAGRPVGHWKITKAPDGTGSAIWTNGTALFRVVGPANVVEDFFNAFPL